MLILNSLGVQVRYTLLAGFITICLLYLLLGLDPRLWPTRANQLSLEAETRVQWWDWNDTNEEIYCRGAHDNTTHSKKPLPNVVHFILLAESDEEVELDYARFLALKAAVLRSDAQEVRLHTTSLNQDNRWWKQLEKHVTFVPINWTSYFPTGLAPPEQGYQLPHQADFLRLAILWQEGGIYFDLDVYALRPFTDLLYNPRDTIMGHEGGNRYGLCNAVIAARPESEFIRRWLKEYGSFNPWYWNYHSVRLPKQMQVLHPDLICPLSPTVFFWPTWAQRHVQYMHREVLSAAEREDLEAEIRVFGGAMFDNQLAFHAVAAKEFLRDLTPRSIREVDTRFNILLRGIAEAAI